ncbi:MAG TPA: zinc ABC transporter substrate-binding protein [Pseudonocardia sp.]|nr:zinc ABC transporter substrate-binding protein [Pseudonocardia sp.]
MATAAVAALALAGCGSATTDDPAPAEPAASAAEPAITVVTSTNVYGAIATAVGGERVAVESLIDDPSADPHSYESTPADAATVAGGDIVVFNGGGYDAFMPGLIESAGGERTAIEVADVSGLVPEGEEPHAEGESHAEGEAHAEGEEHSQEGEGHSHGAFNEHFWYSLPAMKQLATDLAAQFGTADPEGASEYTANAERFGEAVDGLVTKVEAIGAAHGGDRVAVTEPLPGYLLEAARLTDATPPEFSEAVEEDTDPPAAVLQQTLALFEGDPVRVLVLNGQTETPTTDQVRQAAEAAGVPVVEMTETLPEGTIDYVSWMSGQIDALAAALDRA